MGDLTRNLKREKSRLNQYREIRSSKELHIWFICAHWGFCKIQNRSMTYPLLKNSSRPKVFCKRAMLNKSLKWTEKHGYGVFFFSKFVITSVLQNNFFEACNFVKNGHRLRYFPVNFTTFSKTPFLQNTSRLLILRYVTLAKYALLVEF